MGELGLGLIVVLFVLMGREKVWSKDVQRLLQKAFYFHKERKIHPSHNYKYLEWKHETDFYSCLPH